METNRETLRVIAQRITRLLFLAQSLGSAGFIVSGTVNAIVGAALSGQTSWAGVPTMVYQLGAAAAALAWGRAMDRWGRRGTLTIGLLAGTLGALIASVSVAAGALGGFLAGLVLMGMAQAALQLGRFVAAEVSPPSERGRAISQVVLGGTAGAIFGPLMVGPAGDYAQSWGFNTLAGPYFVSFFLFTLTALLLFVGLHPDPAKLSAEVEQLYPEATPRTQATRPLREILRVPATKVAMSAMIFGQLVMVMVMVITSLHMSHHDHSLGNISLVMSSHTVGMFAFSIISGRLVDRWGRGPVIVVGAATLVLACLLAPLSPQVMPLAVALFLLGLGWNFCYVGGSSLLADQLSATERARTQGFNDLLIQMVSAMGSLSSGLVFSQVGYATMGLVGALFALIPLIGTLWWLLRQPRVLPSPTT